MTWSRQRVHVERRLADYPPPTPQPTPCRLWQGYCDHSGYGIRTDNRRMHVWVWEQINGPVPKGMYVLHKCDNVPCFRYDHLFIGTQADNMADMVAKGRYRHGKHATGEAAHKAKLTVEQVRAIRADPRLQAVIAAEYGISQSQVSRIKHGVQWKEDKT